MNATANPTDRASGLALMRVEFPPHQISQLPKGGVKLDYVGHAALTDRLLDCDPNWNWEPMAKDEQGLPRLDEIGGLWIRLTVCGVERLGYGHAGAKKGGDAIKELIGDALRNAAMRFGAALDLWHKGDLHADDDADEQPKGDSRGPYPPSNATPQQRPPAPPQQPAAKEPSSEQREAAAVEAIKMASDDARLNKLELSVIERTGSVFTPSQASRLLALISEQRKKLGLIPAEPVRKGPKPLGSLPPQDTE